MDLKSRFCESNEGSLGHGCSYAKLEQRNIFEHKCIYAIPFAFPFQEAATKPSAKLEYHLRGQSPSTTRWAETHKIAQSFSIWRRIDHDYQPVAAGPRSEFGALNGVEEEGVSSRFIFPHLSLLVSGVVRSRNIPLSSSYHSGDKEPGPDILSPLVYCELVCECLT